jgi:hypothetical protein
MILHKLKLQRSKGRWSLFPGIMEIVFPMIVLKIEMDAFVTCHSLVGKQLLVVHLASVGKKSPRIKQLFVLQWHRALHHYYHAIDNSLDVAHHEPPWVCTHTSGAPC